MIEDLLRQRITETVRQGLLDLDPVGDEHTEHLLSEPYPLRSVVDAERSGVSAGDEGGHLRWRVLVERPGFDPATADVALSQDGEIQFVSFARNAISVAFKRALDHVSERLPLAEVEVVLGPRVGHGALKASSPSPTYVPFHAAGTEELYPEPAFDPDYVLAAVGTRH